MSPTPSVRSGSKPALRAAALAARSALDDETRRAAAQAAARLAAPLVPAGAVVALYAPVRGEMDTLPLARLLQAAGHALALPVVGPRAEPLSFRQWRPGDPLIPGYGRIPEPGPAAAPADPDVLFVPLAAFDGQLHRLGYGAGFYDRTLAALRLQRWRSAFGLAFAVQRVESLPAEQHDVALDAIVTEAALLRAD